MPTYFYCGKYKRGNLVIKQKVHRIRLEQCLHRVATGKCLHGFNDPMDCEAYLMALEKEKQQYDDDTILS